MRPEKFHRSCRLALVCAVAVLGTPLLAAQGACGRHSIEHLNAAFANTGQATLSDARVGQRRVEGATATFNLYGDSESIKIFIGVPTYPRMEMTLQSVGRGNEPWLNPDYGSGSGAAALDMMEVSGCFNERAIPRYIGTGSWTADDGTVVPATMTFYLWIGDELDAGFGIGRFNSQWMSGTIRFDNY